MWRTRNGQTMWESHVVPGLDAMRKMIGRVIRRVRNKDRGNPVGQEEKPPSKPAPEGQAPPPCHHRTLELHFKPCLKCDKFCNCGHTDFPKEYPSILVRSVDKQIVRLSKDMVRASMTLRSLVDETLGDRASAARPSSQLAEEDVIIKTDVNNESSSILGYWKVKADVDDASTAKVAQHHQGPSRGDGGGDAIADLIDLSPSDKVLVMFNPETDEPTLGISKEILMKVDYFICRHLDEVDRRVEGKRRTKEYFRTSRYAANRQKGPDDFDSELYAVNTFAYEDWEEDFFNVDPVTFFAFHQANQELLIWDLYWAIEKWTMLGRGFPSGMINGEWDFFGDPDSDKDDKDTLYGLHGVVYSNPKKKSHHVQDMPVKMLDFDRLGFKPRWWSVKQYPDLEELQSTIGK